ncbi:AbiV family abortive infection protein [Streptomyces sp. NPDC052101]|uniref:AbiV family abortive infection protein n=1 Tax=Streptomyces sp. NPDC052101 TaxID=3155763 RepID=UPI003438E810
MAKLPTDPRLMERMVVDVAAAAFKNARALLTSAQAVLDAHQWPASFSFGALALEEVGKAAMCMMMLAMPPTVPEEFRSGFDKAFTNHQAKAEFAHLVLGMFADEVPASLQQLMDDAIASARQTNNVKFRGLYVDYTDTGALLEPDTVVNESQARWMVTAVTTALAWSNPVEAAVAEPDIYLDFVHQWQDGVDFDALGAYVTASPDQFIAHIRALARDDVPPPTLFLGIALAEQLTAANASASLPARKDPRPTDG